MYKLVCDRVLLWCQPILRIGEFGALQKYSPDVDLKRIEKEITKYKSIIASEPYVVPKVRWRLLINTSPSPFHLFMQKLFKVNVRSIFV